MKVLDDSAGGLQKLIQLIKSTFVQKVEGKGLSTNDYTDADSTKLNGIEAGAEVNVQADWSQTNSSADDFIKNKPTLHQPSSDGTAGQYLKSNGSGSDPSWETMDSSPTENSIKAVTSGGVYTALDGKQASITITTNANTPTDNDTIVMQDNGNTGTTSFLRRKLSTLWTYIKGMADVRYLARYDFVNMPNNGFLNELRYFSSQLNDRLWAADQRFNVTWRGYSSETDEEIYNKDTTAYRLFRGDFELFGSHPVTGEYDIIRIKSKTEGSSISWTYNTGKLILSFYNVAVPPTPPVVRIYGGSTAQWTTLDAPSNPVVSVYVYTMPINPYSVYLKEIEIKVQGKVPGSDPNSAGACLSSVVFIGSRSNAGSESLVTKHAVDQQLYGNITAPKFIMRGGTASQVLLADGTTLSIPVPINKGGTGATTAIGAEYNILNQVADISTTLSDTRKIALCNQTKSASNGVFKWIALSDVWTWIKSHLGMSDINLSYTDSDAIYYHKLFTTSIPKNYGHQSGVLELFTSGASDVLGYYYTKVYFDLRNAVSSSASTGSFVNRSFKLIENFVNGDFGYAVSSDNFSIGWKDNAGVIDIICYFRTRGIYNGFSFKVQSGQGQSVTTYTNTKVTTRDTNYAYISCDDATLNTALNNKQDKITDITPRTEWLGNSYLIPNLKVDSQGHITSYQISEAEIYERTGVSNSATDSTLYHKLYECTAVKGYYHQSGVIELFTSGLSSVMGYAYLKVYYNIRNNVSNAATECNFDLKLFKLIDGNVSGGNSSITADNFSLGWKNDNGDLKLIFYFKTTGLYNLISYRIYPGRSSSIGISYSNESSVSRDSSYTYVTCSSTSNSDSLVAANSALKDGSGNTITDTYFPLEGKKAITGIYKELSSYVHSVDFNNINSLGSWRKFCTISTSIAYRNAIGEIHLNGRLSQGIIYLSIGSSGTPPSEGNISLTPSVKYLSMWSSYKGVYWRVSTNNELELWWKASQNYDSLGVTGVNFSPYFLSLNTTTYHSGVNVQWTNEVSLTQPSNLQLAGDVTNTTLSSAISYSVGNVLEITDSNWTNYLTTYQGGTPPTPREGDILTLDKPYSTVIFNLGDSTNAAKIAVITGGSDVLINGRRLSILGKWMPQEGGGALGVSAVGRFSIYLYKYRYGQAYTTQGYSESLLEANEEYIYFNGIWYGKGY